MNNPHSSAYYASVHRPHNANSRYSPVPITRPGTHATNTRPPSKPPFNFFALTIAINQYQYHRYPLLKGCVADAEDVEHYLSSGLGVPSSQIRSLRNQEATRSAILKALKAFESDKSIGYGDPILIYFAGHGGETRQQTQTGTTDIQFLIPYDCEMRDRNGEKVHGIPDFLLGQILKQIGNVKGNNITVILDNCHSGSGSRELNSPYINRSVSYNGGLPPEFATLNSLGGSSTPTSRLGTASSRIGGFGTTASSVYPNGLNWHSVLLAACSSKEKAREHKGRGLFTQALLETMRSLGPGIQGVTYGELFGRIPKLECGDQNPQCESDHKNRFVFRQEVKNLPAPVKPTLPGQNATVCLRIYTQQDDSKMSSALQALRSLTHLANMSEITYEPQQGRARFSLSFNRTSQRIEITDEMKRTLPRTLPRSTSVFEFRDIFHGIGFYDYYLRRSEPDLAGIVTVSIYNAAYDGSRNGHNLVQGGADIDIVEDGSYFVIELRNQTSRDLYPTLFCFDSSEFSIHPLYSPPTIEGRQRVDAPLRARDNLIIGIESTDARRLVACVRNNHDIEIGFLKLFVTSEYVDLSGMAQESPLNCARARGMKQIIPKPPKNVVRSTTIPFIVRSAQKSSQFYRSRGMSSNGQEPRQRGDADQHTLSESWRPVFDFITDTRRPVNNSSVDALGQQMEGMTMRETPPAPPSYKIDPSTLVQKIDNQIRVLDQHIRKMTTSQELHHRELEDIRRYLHQVADTVWT